MSAIISENEAKTRKIWLKLGSRGLSVKDLKVTGANRRKLRAKT